MPHLNLIRDKLLHPLPHGRENLRYVFLGVRQIPVDARFPAPVHGVVQDKIPADHLRHLFDSDLAHGADIVFVQPGDLQIARDGTLIERKILFVRLLSGDCHLRADRQDIVQVRLLPARFQHPERRRIISAPAPDQVHAVQDQPLVQGLFLDSP